MNSLPESDGRTRALADLAFGSQTHVADASRPLAWLSPEELEIDLDDPVQRRFGDYELLEKIGQGGMGVVYRARQHGLERDVALKLLAAGPWASAEFVERFRREARSAARMQHPNIVEIYEFGHRDGLNYFSMRLIEGESLAQRLTAGGPMEPREAALLLRTLAEAMDYAHRLGVLHLDLKPANVLLTPAGTPLVADFGLARRIDAGHEGGNSEISGTPSYMAPEQAQLQSHPLSASTDIYGLGAILYEALTGFPPFVGASAQSTLERVLAESPVAPRRIRPALPADLEAICLKCLQKDPAQRYPGARELADDLGRFLEARPVTVRPLGMLQRAHRWMRREPSLAAAFALAALALCIGVSTTTWQWRQAVAQRIAAQKAEQRAAAERDRAQTAGEIGAWLYAHSGKTTDSDDLARDLISWLRQRWPGRDSLQADALTAFASSVNAEQRQSADFLLAAIVRVLGADYRRQAIHSLQARKQPEADLYAAMLAWSDVATDAGPAQFESLMRTAVEARPDDAFTLQVAAVYCPEEGCVVPDGAARLVRADPDNMYNWLLLAMASPSSTAMAANLHEAAKRARFDDYLSASYQAYVKAIEMAKLPVPPLLGRPVSALAPNARPELSIALNEASQFPLPNWQPLIRLCLPADLATLAPQIRADCLTVGERMARSGHALVSQMIGVAMVKPLAKGSALAEEMQRLRTQYAYLSSVEDQLDTQQLKKNYPVQRFLDDMTSAGELESLKRRAQFFGLPEQPPAGWQPKDPVTLMIGRERLERVTSAEDAAQALMAKGDLAGVVAVLAPVESIAAKQLQGRNAWRLPRLLITLGKARTGVGDFAGAEKNLKAAWEIVQSFGPGASSAHECAQALTELYRARQKARPGTEADARLANWQRIVADFESSGSKTN